jgi:hypothetical protein
MNFQIVKHYPDNAYYCNQRLVIVDFSFDIEALKRFLGIKSFDIPEISELWNMFRSKFCPTRILQYGTISRDYVGDDRTLFEKLCDYISEQLFERRQNIRNGRAVWNGFGFFDWGTGQQVTNMTQIHEIERATGKQMVSWRDKEVEASKIERQMVADEKAKIKKKIHHVFSEVQKGRSYTREIRADREAMRKQFQ